MTQGAIADRTKLSESAISHLLKCFRNLGGKAREMCKAMRMNADACYSLASAPDFDRERILQCAIKIRKTNDSLRSILFSTSVQRADRLHEAALCQISPLRLSAWHAFFDQPLHRTIMSSSEGAIHRRNGVILPILNPPIGCTAPAWWVQLMMNPTFPQNLCYQASGG